MKRTIKYPLVAACLALLVSLSACSDSFLEPEPQSFFSPETVYTDRAGFEALLVTLRRNLAHAEFYGGRGNAFNIGQWHESEAGIGIWLMDRDVLTPSGEGRVAYYQQVSMLPDVYEYVKDANTIIDRIDDIEWESEDDRDEILAEAMWHRAYWYNRLVHDYGDVPFVGEEVTEPRLDFQTHSRWAILDKIQEDMEWAVDHLPESAVPGAITRGAGNHLLAKIYLANMEWDNAIDAATEVINGPYALMTGRFGEDADDESRNVIWDLHRPMNKNHSSNSETILAGVDRYDAPSDARSAGLNTMRTYHPDWWHSRHRDSEGNAGMIDEGPQYDSLGRGNPDIALTEFLQYHVWEDEENDWEETPDLRRADANWVDVHEMTYNNPESVDYDEPWNLEYTTGDPARSITSMYAMPVYKTMVPEQSSGATPAGGNGDWYIYRLAETYLIRAEAHYWNDNLGAAADDINVVRERAEAPPISAGDVTIDFIFDERLRELFVEEMRHNELVRVSFTMAELGMNGYSPETLHESNWWYDRLIEHNFYYPEHPESGNSISIGIPYPIGDQIEIVGGIHPNINPYNFLWPIHDELISANQQGRINQNLGYRGADNNEPPLDTID